MCVTSRRSGGGGGVEGRVARGAGGWGFRLLANGARGWQRRLLLPVVGVVGTHTHISPLRYGRWWRCSQTPKFPDSGMENSAFVLFWTKLTSSRPGGEHNQLALSEVASDMAHGLCSTCGHAQCPTLPPTPHPLQPPVAVAAAALADSRAGAWRKHTSGWFCSPHVHTYMMVAPVRAVVALVLCACVLLAVATSVVADAACSLDEGPITCEACRAGGDINVRSVVAGGGGVVGVATTRPRAGRAPVCATC